MKLTAAELTGKIVDIIAKVEPNPNERLTLERLEQILVNIVIFFLSFGEKAKAAGDRI